jgi:diaminobutyrate-2-oxoglutarate transaminase
MESRVNYYGKIFPVKFERAIGEVLIDENNKEYLDFFSGAGALNYGHNHPELAQNVKSFLEQNYIIHSLDMNSQIRKEFLDAFKSIILKPRNLDFKIQFPGPTGTNAVEAAIKIARKATSRTNIIAFTNSFHGMTSMSYALSGSRDHAQSYNTADGAIFMPFDQYESETVDSFNYLKKMIENPGTGFEKPAAIILETIQGEGGINVASKNWLKKIRDFTSKHQILLIVDDIQMGCGRTGDFFSFENSDIHPDIVLLSKSLSGFGLPLSMVLLKPEFDLWTPGEYNGTFRSNNLALRTALSSLNFWKNDSFLLHLSENIKYLKKEISRISQKFDPIVGVRGRGMVWGLEFESPDLSKQVAEDLFNSGVLIETCGPRDEVIKLLPPLNISKENLKLGLNLLSKSIQKFCPNRAQLVK